MLSKLTANKEILKVAVVSIVSILVLILLVGGEGVNSYKHIESGGQYYVYNSKYISVSSIILISSIITATYARIRHYRFWKAFIYNTIAWTILSIFIPVISAILTFGIFVIASVFVTS